MPLVEISSAEYPNRINVNKALRSAIQRDRIRQKNVNQISNEFVRVGDGLIEGIVRGVYNEEEVIVILDRMYKLDSKYRVFESGSLIRSFHLFTEQFLEPGIDEQSAFADAPQGFISRKKEAWEIMRTFGGVGGD